jgi:hypothetical protein
MVFLVMLLIAVVVVVLVMRAASSQDGGTARTPRPPRAREQVRPLAPDDDPDFIRELERRTRRDDGSPA